MSVIIISPNWHWNGALANRARTDYIALHHAEASSCTAEQVDQWHKENGWSGIGYHFFVRKDGKIYRGRPLDKQGAHVYGMNNRSIGICAEGKYSTETMPDEQKRAICRLLAYLKDCYYPNAQIVGHKEIGDSDCPGRNYPLEDIKQNYRAYAAEKEVDEVSREEYNALAARVEKLEKQQDTMIYNYVDKNMPAWAHEAVKWCVDKGIIQGTGDGLGLSNTKLWVCVVMYRLAKYIAKLVGMKV